MYWYLEVLKNYATFDGRARRKEYWYFFLVNTLISIFSGFVFGVVGALTKHPELAHFSTLYSLATLIPSIAVGIRRMHDTDHSGWWMLCPFYNLVLCCMAGNEKPNRFGPDPKAPNVQKIKVGGGGGPQRLAG